MTKEKMTTEKKTIRNHNSKPRDSSSKIIFEDPVLCAQFLKGYIDIPILKNVQPEDIEDVSERYVHMFMEERNSDVVKKIYVTTENNQNSVYLISLIEHKSQVDYNVIMQILRYMVFIWEDYEKEMERQYPGISQTKDFRYPPILPIVYYEGSGEWSAATRLIDRILLNDIFQEYIPDFRCHMVQLRNYSNVELMEKRDELSIIFLISKLQDVADFAGIGEGVTEEYLKEIIKDSPEYLLNIIAKVVEALLLKVNVTAEEAENFAGQIKEKRMGMLFENLTGYDVQATRREEREKTLEEDITKLIILLKNHGFVKEEVKKDLMEAYSLTEKEATLKVEKYWEKNNVI